MGDPIGGESGNALPLGAGVPEDKGGEKKWKKENNLLFLGPGNGSQGP